MRLTKASTDEQMNHIRELYSEAFPLIEQKPFDILKKKAEEGVVEFLAIEAEDGAFKGLAITALYGDMVLLDYFAVAASERGNGVGSAALGLLKEHYADRRFILEIERTDVEADNIGQRLKRKSFYLRNGMKPMPFLVDVFGTEMEVLTYDCEVKYEEYHRLYEIFGKELERKVTLVGQR